MSAAKDGLLNTLAELLPNRSSNRGVGGVKALVEAVAHELAAVADRIEALYDDAFVQTAAAGSRRWLRPLLAGLLVVAVGVACRRRKRPPRSEG